MPMPIERRPFLVALVCGVLLSCGSARPAFQPLNRTMLRATRPRTVAVAISRGQRFGDPMADSTSGGPFYPIGLLGYGVRAQFGYPAESHAAEAKIKQEWAEEPARQISVAIVGRLAKRFALEVVDRNQLVTSSTSPETLAAEYGGVDLILDVRTASWGLFGTRPDRFGIAYDGYLRLIDARNKTVLAEGNCSSRPVDGPDVASVKALVRDDGARFKDDLASLVDFCTEDYGQRILGLYQ
jgi:hypothetical protein